MTGVGFNDPINASAMLGTDMNEERNKTEYNGPNRKAWVDIED
jgi:hypothetical protein